MDQLIQAYELTARQHVDDEKVVASMASLAVAKLRLMNKALEERDLKTVAGLLDELGRAVRCLYLGCSSHPNETIAFHGCRLVGFVWQKIAESTETLDPQPLEGAIMMMEEFAAAFKSKE